jgi:hypothetical protein
MTSALRAIEAEVRAAASAQGYIPRRLQLVSPLGERKGMRYAYRIDTRDGRTIKARCFGSTEEAERVFALRRDLEHAFAPVLARAGSVLLEEWIEGDMLRPSDVESWAGPAGALLGRLHARPLGPETAPDVDTARWSEAAAADLALLGEAQILATAERVAVAAAIRNHDPGRARVALIHKDFCGENLLVDARGELRIVDTEVLAIEPIGFDLAWTRHRWVLPTPSHACFSAGYLSAAPCAPEAEAYWQLVTGVLLARVFFQRRPERLLDQLGKLRQCLAAATRPAP